MNKSDKAVMQQMLNAWQTSYYGSVSHHKAMLLATTDLGKAIAQSAHESLASDAIECVARPAADTQANAWAALEELKACAQSGTGIVNPDAYNVLRRFIASAIAQPKETK